MSRIACCAWFFTGLLLIHLSPSFAEPFPQKTLIKSLGSQKQHLFDLISKVPRLPENPNKSIVKGTPSNPPLPGVLGLDLFPGTPHFIGNGIGVIDDDFDIDTIRSATRGETFSTVVRLNDTENLLGITFDFRFDSDRLQVLDIRETRMDLDFSGDQSFVELQAVVDFFFSNELPDLPSVDNFAYTYNDGTGEITTHPGLLLDLDGNGVLSFVEIHSYAREFLANLDDTDIPFWTEIAARRPGFNDSVEVFDLVADINDNGEGTDNTVVLLRRPETPALDFGYDGNAILFEIVFQVKENAPLGEAMIQIEDSSAIDENFADINTDTRPVVVVEGGSKVVVE
ncbi:MAG: hypothetical protein KC978_00420 [Candidatus Omnitrophica bacterium]|nr:hypothetical protein [Candidatus Omnitrophota bacterium]